MKRKFLTARQCHSADLRRLPMVYAAGSYEFRGRLRAFFFGGANTLQFGTYTGKCESRLSQSVRPPGKLPFVRPVCLWIMGFFILMAFLGSGRLSFPMGILGGFYLLLLPSYLLGSLFYNVFVRPWKYRRWERSWLCLRCGAVVDGASPTRPWRRAELVQH